MNHPGFCNVRKYTISEPFIIIGIILCLTRLGDMPAPKALCCRCLAQHAVHEPQAPEQDGVAVFGVQGVCGRAGVRVRARVPACAPCRQHLKARTPACSPLGWQAACSALNVITDLPPPRACTPPAVYGMVPAAPALRYVALEPVLRYPRPWIRTMPMSSACEACTDAPVCLLVSRAGRHDIEAISQRALAMRGVDRGSYGLRVSVPTPRVLGLLSVRSLLERRA